MSLGSVGIIDIKVSNHKLLIAERREREREGEEGGREREGEGGRGGREREKERETRREGERGGERKREIKRDGGRIKMNKIMTYTSIFVFKMCQNSQQKCGHKNRWINGGLICNKRIDFTANFM